MSWRTVVVSHRAKLDLKMNCLVVRQEVSVNKIYLGEISNIIVEDTSVSLTACLLCELMKRKIKVIFCDEKRNPCSELVPYYGSHDTSLRIKSQINWSKEAKETIWTEIVAEKIRQQSKLLEKYNLEEHKLLETYVEEIKHNDETNREGLAARAYFNALFGKTFTRADENNINSALNYGYAILLSAFNREIVANGYITQLGLFHDNMYNQFNLGCDLMEPFRPIIDRKVKTMDLYEFAQEEKMQLVNVLNSDVVIDNKVHVLNNAIRIYCKSIFDAIEENDVSLIRFYRNEL